MREAPSLKIISDLQKSGAHIKAFDPVAMDNAKKLMPDLVYCNDTYEVADGSDAMIFITEWNQFRSLDLDKIKSLMNSPIIIDLRNIYHPEKMREKGFQYTSVGRR
jgi:UDPglucose 6-dehydrogenase